MKENNTGVQVPQQESTPGAIRAAHFNALYSLNLNDKTEKKNGLTYLSWAYAWSEFKKVYPDATYRIIKNPQNNLPYFVDDDLGIIVYTEVTADDLTYEMWLPVLDSANKSMKLQPYTYYVYDRYNKQNVEKTVAAASMFEINKAIMRCLTKNLCMFGEGLYIYAGEDLPEDVSAAEADSASQKEAPVTPRRSYTRKAMTQSINSVPQPQPQPTYDRFAGIKAALQATTTVAELYQLYNQHKNEVDNNEAIRNLFTERKNQLTFNAA